MPLAEFRGHPDRDGQEHRGGRQELEGPDHRLEAALRGGGLEGLRPGARLLRHGLDRNRARDAGGTDRRWAFPRRPSSKSRRTRPTGVAEVKTILQNLKGWNSQTTWSRLDGILPHLIPADPATSLKQDIILYENAMIFPGSSSGQANATSMAFLQVPEMIKLGDVWKFIDLPRPVDPSKPVVASEGGIRASLFREQVSGAPGGASGPRGWNPP